MKEEKFFFPTISDVLNELLGEKNLSVETVAALSDVNPVTIYRIMNKQRNPSRNVILRIAMAMELSIEETQVLLKSGNCSLLSASRERDLIIMEGIINGKYYDVVNDTLTSKNMLNLDGRG